MKRYQHIFEVLEAVAATQHRKDKVAILRANKTQGLLDILNGAFNEYLEWDLPKGTPPFESNVSEEGIYPTNLKKHTTRLGICVKHPLNANVPKMKKERAFIQMLEGIHPKDADVLIKMKDKKFKGLYRGLTVAIVREAFPGLLPPATADEE